MQTCTESLDGFGGIALADLSWFINRLKAMSIPEIAWRLNQKAICRNEQKQFCVSRLSVTSKLFNSKLSGLTIDERRLHLNIGNRDFNTASGIRLPGDFNYSEYKEHWHAGFQTPNDWPIKFSYALEYKQRDDIGDARTNWELNRHFQFAVLAKNYAASHNQKYLDEFTELFSDWNEKNSFLWGISWTSVMEIAIRSSNWCYSYCFLKSANAPEELLNKLQTGILNMTDYITKHYSRYSSANNHLIIEAYAIGQTGILCDHQPWIKLAVDILTRELPLQNYSDGVNKELSLHYQSFYMEAMGLMMRLLIKNGYSVTNSWKPMLEKMCTYIADCMGDYGESIVFGDDDGGKILDLQGGIDNHYQYTLGLLSVMLDKQYTDLGKLSCENLNWLFDEDEWNAARQKPLYRPPLCVCYKEGGNTILRSNDRRILIGIDHAALGFGSIAAHGHADALSFQLFVDGQPIFVDPGTYIYHCDLNSRNAFRKTGNHNTVMIESKDQSEMLGAFLWGKRAECKLISYEDKPDKTTLVAEHDGYRPIIHRRTYEFDGNRELRIKDELSAACDYMLTFELAPNAAVQVKDNTVIVSTEVCTCKIELQSKDDFEIYIRDTVFSERYGACGSTRAVSVRPHGIGIISRITIEEKNDEDQRKIS